MAKLRNTSDMPTYAVLPMGSRRARICPRTGRGPIHDCPWRRDRSERRLGPNTDFANGPPRLWACGRVATIPEIRVPRRRWGIGVLLGSGILVSFLDRINLSIAAPQLQKALNIGPAGLGVLLSA